MVYAACESADGRGSSIEESLLDYAVAWAEKECAFIYLQRELHHDCQVFHGESVRVIQDSRELWTVADPRFGLNAVSIE